MTTFHQNIMVFGFWSAFLYQKLMPVSTPPFFCTCNTTKTECHSICDSDIVVHIFLFINDTRNTGVEKFRDFKIFKSSCSFLTYYSERKLHTWCGNRKILTIVKVLQIRIKLCKCQKSRFIITFWREYN